MQAQVTLQRLIFKQGKNIKYMEITGKIIAVLPERSGVSARTGSEWRMGSYVLETINEQYPRRMNFEVFGSDKLQQFNIQLGETMVVSFDIDAREYHRPDGTVTWFNSIRAWKVDRNLQNAMAPVQAAPVQTADIPPFAAAPQAAPQAAPVQQANPFPPMQESAESADGGDDLPF